MALETKSALFYGIEVNGSNYALDFSVGATVYNATLRAGTYTADTLCTEIIRAMQEADISNTYSATYSRFILLGAIQSRITISGPTHRLLFATGPRTAVNCANLLGFLVADSTVATTHTGVQNFGSVIEPELIGYSYQPPETMQKTVGSLNISASGIKEAIVFSQQRFFQVEFKHEPAIKLLPSWEPFFIFATQQKLIEFAENRDNPASTIQCTLESTEFDGKGMGWLMREMLPDFPFYYRTGILKFRVKPEFLAIV